MSKLKDSICFWRAVRVLFALVLFTSACYMALACELDYKTKGGGYYRVTSADGSQVVSSHTTEREALQNASNLSAKNKVLYVVTHDYRAEIYVKTPEATPGAPPQEGDENATDNPDEGGNITPDNVLLFQWSPPSQREDGTPLQADDIIEYLVYGGTSANDLRPVTGFQNIPGLSRYEELIPGNLTHFALSAIDREGLESELSNIVEVSI